MWIMGRDCLKKNDIFAWPKVWIGSLLAVFKLDKYFVSSSWLKFESIPAPLSKCLMHMMIILHKEWSDTWPKTGKQEPEEKEQTKQEKRKQQQKQ